MKKRAIAPIIATTLLVTFVIILGVVVSVWMRTTVESYVEEEEENIGGELTCLNVKIQLEKKDDISIYIKNNGETRISGYTVVVYDANGKTHICNNYTNSQIEPYNAIKYPPSTNRKCEGSESEDLSDKDKIKIIPWIAKGEINSECNDKAITLQLEEPLPFCGDTACNGDEICGDTDNPPECNTDCGTCPPEGNDEYTKLLLHLDGNDGDATTTDTSSSGHSITFVGDSHIEQDQSKFGGTSSQFDGTGDYLSIPDSDDWNFGSDDFTVDFWVHPLSETNYGRGLFIRVYSLRARMVASYGLYVHYYLAGDSDYTLAHSGSHIPLNQWTHIAIVRQDDSLIIFKDGIILSTHQMATGATLNNDARPFLIGHGTGEGRNWPLNGYLDEFRISKGIARWTENFTPPEEPYG